MTHGERQHDAAIRQLHLAARAQIVFAVPDVQIGMADAGMGDLEQHLLAVRRGDHRVAASGHRRSVVNPSGGPGSDRGPGAGVCDPKNGSSDPDRA